MSDPVRVVLVDDQATIREALALMLDLDPRLDVVATGANGQEAVTLVAEHRPDVLLTDLRMPVMDGAQATEVVLATQPDLAVLLLTTFDDEESILSALSAGARGYLTKEAGRAEIIAAILAVAAGQSVLDPNVQKSLVRRALGTAPATTQPDRVEVAHNLTKRECEVLALIGDGLSNREIARRLFLSEATIKTHINNLFTKTEVRDRAQAIRYAYAHGLSSPPT